MLKRILSDQRGYGLAELLMVTTIVAVFCGVVVSVIAPKIGELHNNARTSIKSLGGSGI